MATKGEDSKEVRSMQREFMVKDSFSEADNQQQNPVELDAIQWLKEKTMVLMDRTNCPEEGALDAMRCLANVQNILSEIPSLQNHSLDQAITGP